MRDPYEIIKRPLLTEKSDRLRESANQYCFEVDIRANKMDVKHAVESLFDVKVSNVNLVKMKGKVKRMGRFEGKRANWKKAFVTLGEGEFIELFEGI